MGKSKGCKGLCRPFTERFIRMTGISLRTIQNYESGARMPKKRETYSILARELHVDGKALLSDEAEFIHAAAEKYGCRGRKQTLKLTNEVAGLYAGVTLEEKDLDAMMQAIQETYWDAKKHNEKYSHPKYEKNEESSEE